MLDVKVTDNTVIVWMHGTAYTLNNQFDIADFKADMGWFTSLEELVLKYMDKLQRVIKRIAAAVKIATVNIVRSNLGFSPISFWAEQKLRWCN
jgi:hypothetical protein